MASFMTWEEKEAEKRLIEAGDVCPNNHPVGRYQSRTKKKCCREYCAKDAESIAAGAPLASLELAGDGPEKKLGEELATAHALFIERLRSAKVPAKLTGDAAVEWSQQRMADLLPHAVAELQWQLRYGTAKARSEAVDTILRANGVAQKEVATGNSPTIILNLGGKMDVPFLDRMPTKKKDGTE